MDPSPTTRGDDPAPLAAQPSRGATLEQVVEHLRALGEPCATSAGGSQAWLQYPRGALLRFPLDCTEPVGADVAARLLALRGVWLLNHLLAPDERRPANCVEYVCSDPEYDLPLLQRKARQNARRGLRTFTVRRCTWNEWAEQGFPAHAETTQRHGYARPAPAEFARLAARWKGAAWHEIWGAWDGGALVAWLTVVKVNDWAMVDLTRSRTQALEGRANNALLFHATRSLLAGEKLRLVTLGTSTLQPGTGEASMHRYKVAMGFQAVPRHRAFVCHRLLRPLVASRGAAWAWGRLASAWPTSAPVRKLAGMAQLLTGRSLALGGAAEQDEVATQE